MIDRYVLFAESDTLANLFGLSKVAGYTPTFNAAPTKNLPIITQQQPKELQFGFWGIIPQMAKSKSISQRLFNLEWEKANSSGMHKKSLAQNRVIIPASGFYFWRIQGKKQFTPHFAFLDNKKTIAIAGTWSYFDDEKGKSKICFTMLLHTANEQKNDDLPAHMPLIIDPRHYQSWLDNNQPADTLSNCFMDFDPNQWSHYTVSHGIKDIMQDHKGLMERTKPVDQFGNYTLFD